MSQIGEVIAVNGVVQAVTESDARALEIGSPVNEGDEIVTGPTANVEIRFTDGSVLAQGPSANMSLDEYVYDPNEPSASNMFYQAATGTFRVVTGKIAELNPDGVEVKTPLATIGIRGTGMDIESKDEGLKVGIFYYHEFDVVITSPTGTRFITDGDILIEIFPDGTFGEPRAYTAEEKMTFETMAPITSLGDIMDEDEAEEGEEGEEGEEQVGEEEEAEEAEEGEQPTEETVEIQVEEVFPVITGLLGMDVTLLVPPGQDLDFGDLTPDIADINYEILDEDEIGPDEAAGETQGDVITGTSGNDVLLGSSSDETLSGLAGNDYIFGGGGNDWIIGGAGQDSLYGGDGDDTFVFYTGDAVSGEIIDGDAGNNQIYVISNDADFSGASMEGSTFMSILLGSGQTAEFAGSQISGQSWTIQGQGSNSITITDCCGETIDLRGLSFPALGGQYMDQLILDASSAVFKFTAAQLLGIPGGLKIGVPSGGDVNSLQFQIDPGTYTGSLFDLFDFSGVSGHPSLTELLGDTLTGTQSADTLIGTSAADSILAKDGDDSIIGDTGGDTIYGCDGNDTIEGGGGNDYLYGGEGDDQFYFDSDQGTGYIYGGIGTDSLVIDGDADLSEVWGFSSIEKLAFLSAGSQFVVGGEEIGFWDVFGGSLSGLVIKAVGGDNTWTNYTYLDRLDTFLDWYGRVIFEDGGYNDSVRGSSEADSMVGGDGNDTLDGNEENDTLLGGVGNDCLMGDVGNDCLSGGSGNDTLDPGPGTDNVNGGSGTDILSFDYTSTPMNEPPLAPGSGTISHDGQTVNYSSIEGFEATNGSDTLLGTSGNDRIYGNSGNDEISAMEGADYVGGGYGNDIISGLTGNDTLLGNSGNDCILGECDHDYIDGGYGDDCLFGGGENDTILGNSGYNRIWGDDGEDSLVGGTGIDTLNGGLGNDILDGGSNDDSLYGAENNDSLFGGYGDDTLDGGTGNDSLNGYYGDDTLIGNAGDDYILGGSGFDFVDYSANATALTIVMSQTSAFTVANASTDTVSGVEGIIGTDLAGSGDNITGDPDFASYLLGLDGADTLTGGDASDTLDGGDGDDCLAGGLGDDWIIPGDDVDNSGDDTVEVDGGSDTNGDILSLSYSNVAFTGTFTPGANSLSHDGVTVNYTGIEALSGTGEDDDITGTAGVDRLYGDDGSDTLDGLAGNDSLYGGDNSDWLYGGDDEDYLSGGNGADSLYGEAGDDTLMGEAGYDVLFGGAGANVLSGGDTYYTDKFVFNVLDTSDDADQITDFDFYSEDQIWIDDGALLFTSVAPTATNTLYFDGTKLNVLYPEITTYTVTTNTTTLTTTRSSATMSYSAGYLAGWNLSAQRSATFKNTTTFYNLQDPPDQTITHAGYTWNLTNSSFNVNSQYSSLYYAWYTRTGTHWIATFTKTSTNKITSTIVTSIVGTGVKGSFSSPAATARVPYLWKATELSAALGDTGVAEDGVAFVWDSAGREFEAWFVEAGDTNTTQVDKYVIASLTGSGDPNMDTDIYIY